MSETNMIKIKNALNRTFNGVRPQKTILVPKDQVDQYIANGFEIVNVVLEKKLKEDQEKLEKEQAELEAQANAELEAQASAEVQATEQEKLDQDYQAKNEDPADLWELAEDLENVEAPKTPAKKSK